MSKVIHDTNLSSFDEHSASSATFVIEPLHSGYGMTLGNSLRRVLLSSIAGAAITSFKIEGVTHEFFGMGAVVDDANDAVAEAADRLTESFSGTGASATPEA